MARRSETRVSMTSSGAPPGISQRPERGAIQEVREHERAGAKVANPLVHAAMHAAVHAWTGGHIEAESRAGTQRLPETAADAPDPMPSPPFPDPHATALADIVDELSQRFATDSDAVAAVFVATGSAIRPASGTVRSVPAAPRARGPQTGRSPRVCGPAWRP